MTTENIIFLSIIGILIVLFLIDKFTNHTILQTILQWKPALAALTALAKAIASALPSSDFALAVTILEAASKATQRAEELYKLNALPKEDRNAYAQTMIAQILSDAGIEVTAQVQQIIDGCIAVICLLMPHNVTPDGVTPNAQAETMDGKLVDAPC